MGETTRIEVTDDLLTGTWSNVWSFSASSELTNLTLTVEGEKNFVRTAAP